jgi:hypothetical protein
VALRHGRLAYLSVAGTDLSSYFNSLSLDIEVENADTSTFGNSWRTNLAGLIGATVTAEGFYDPTASTGPVAVILAAITTCQGGTPVAIVLREGGTANGQTNEAFNANITSFGRSASLDGAVALTLGMQVTGAITPSVQ